MRVSSNEHTGHPFTIILVFALVISYLSLEEEMDGVGVPGFRRLHSIPFWESVLFIKPVSRRPVGLRATPSDQGTHILFASQPPPPLKTFARVKSLRQAMPSGKTWPLRFLWFLSFYPTDTGSLTGTLVGTGWSGWADRQAACGIQPALFPRHRVRSELILASV